MVQKRIAAPVTASALILASLVTAGSATNTTARTTAPQAAPDALLAAKSVDSAAVADPAEPAAENLVGLVPAAPDAPRKLRAMSPPADGMFSGTVPLQDIALPGGTGVLGIPEIVLAAYRNAELALESSMPGCGLPWNLLAGIGRIESLHASSGRTDAAGTTISPIYGPALDGTLPGNEIIKAADGTAVRALGPMQFLPGTWSLYASDGNGDGVSDPHNVFDAALAAGKYLCSGGLDMRDQQQQLRAVLRYNNSMSYAADVLSWSHAYKTGGAPTQVTLSPDLIPPGSLPTATVPDMTLANNTIPNTTTAEQPPTTTVAPQTPQTQTQVMITIPGLPPIPCGIFCPAPPPVNPCEQAAVPAPMPKPGEAEAAVPNAGKPEEQAKPEQTNQQFGPDGRPVEQTVNCANPDAAQQQQPAPQQAPNPQNQAPAQTQNPEPAPAEQAQPAPEAAPETPPAPAITLPFGITIPLPAPAPAPAP
ncbi:lytic murein transglycosylase [Nocardia sp. NPDC050406]|uniref:lytic transglycosylase domain-containing protein n=1 Tax=Nocardia sp. NPDC050406 TaxID=3364318 RepID=UPI00379F3D74